VLLAMLLVLSGVVAPQTSCRGSASQAWTEVGEGDPRVAGVFRRRSSAAWPRPSIRSNISRSGTVWCFWAGHQLAHALGR